MEILNEEEELYAKIEFNSHEKEIIIPPKYDKFVAKICKRLDINIDDPNSVLDFKYKDENDMIEMNSDEDYNQLLEDIREAKSNIDVKIIIKLKGNSNLDINKCTQNFIKYPEEKSNKKEVIKDDDRINIDNSNLDNSNMNFINTEKNGFTILNVKMDNNNKNSNNNINKKNQINNNNINNNDFSQKYITFLETCDVCYKYPIINILYYCLKCENFVCENCEREPYIHRHSYIKVQTKEQYRNLNEKINNKDNETKSKLNQIYNGIKNSLKTIPIKEPLLMSLLEIARKKYNLKNIDDNKLKEALIKANGDIDKAIIFLQK